MTRSLRRTLAIRFAATMAVGLVAASAAVFWFTHQLLVHPIESGLSTTVVQRDLAVALAAVFLFGTGATLIGAWHLAGRAVRPVMEITEQATRVQAGTLDQRIVAHAQDREYSGLVAVLNGMLERLDAAFRSQRRLTADVSHELRTPLTALQGEIEVALRTERAPREYQRVLRSALEEIDRLTEMSDDLLLITRAEGRLLEPRRSPTDLGDLARRGVEGLKARIEEKGLAVDVCSNGASRPLPLDPGLVERLIGHLLDNAVKFAPIEGRIRIAVEGLPSGGGLRLAVEDSGAGFAPEELVHAFEPFYRADPARSRGTGTGLGLALVAAIARLHGGTARALNLAGGGARVEVDFPVARLEEAEAR